MPRTRRSGVASEVMAAYTPPRALIASAQNYKVKKLTTTGGTRAQLERSDWHADAWNYYDVVGEYRYSVDWVGNLLSRAKLKVLKGGQEVSEQDVLDILDALFGGPEGQADMLRKLGQHWTIAGDCYVIGVVKENSEDSDWLVAAASETTLTQEGEWKVDDELFPSSALVIRVWRPHPKQRKKADAPTRAVIPILAEIDGLTKHVAAQIDSRLAGAGILFVPTAMTIGGSSERESDDAETPEASTPDQLVRLLINTASDAITDRGDPAALVPIVIQAEGEAIQHVKHLTFATDLDKQAIELRTEAIRRLALGMDMPPEVLTGTADLNHWSSWQVEEAAIKAHTEPLLAEICASLTTGYLRPALDRDDADEYELVADTSALRLRPNRSKEAIELWDRGALATATMLKENGFDPDVDVMPEDEKIVWLLTKVAGGSATPDQVQAALAALGAKLEIQPGASGGDGTQDTREARPDPSKADHPVREIPTPEKSKSPAIKEGADADTVVMASAVLVHRALERAGNRIKNRLNGKVLNAQGHVVPAHQAYRFVKLDFSAGTMDFLLEDAWGAVDSFSGDLGVSSEWLTNALDGYTRGLLQDSRGFTREGLSHHLTRMGL